MSSSSSSLRRSMTSGFLSAAVTGGSLPCPSRAPANLVAEREQSGLLRTGVVWVRELVPGSEAVRSAAAEPTACSTTTCSTKVCSATACSTTGGSMTSGSTTAGSRTAGSTCEAAAMRPRSFEEVCRHESESRSAYSGSSMTKVEQRKETHLILLLVLHGSAFSLVDSPRLLVRFGLDRRGRSSGSVALGRGRGRCCCGGTGREGRSDGLAVRCRVRARSEQGSGGVWGCRGGSWGGVLCRGFSRGRRVREGELSRRGAGSGSARGRDVQRRRAREGRKSTHLDALGCLFGRRRVRLALSPRPAPLDLAARRSIPRRLARRALLLGSLAFALEVGRGQRYGRRCSDGSGGGEFGGGESSGGGVELVEEDVLRAVNSVSSIQPQYKRKR